MAKSSAVVSSFLRCMVTLSLKLYVVCCLIFIRSDFRYLSLETMYSSRMRVVFDWVVMMLLIRFFIRLFSSNCRIRLV